MNNESTTNQPASPMHLISALLEQSGGIQGLMQSFEVNGLGGLMKTWIGNEQNAKLSADEIGKILSSENFKPVLAKLGISPEEANEQVARYLPQVIDRLTPNGKVNENHFSLASLIETGESLLKH